MNALLILTRWHLRQLFWINCLAVCCVLMFALFSTSAITFANSYYLILGIVAHSGAMVLLLGRSEPRGPGFLYAQGFSRDQLWWSTFGATLCSGVLVCLCFWLAIVTGLRSVIQEASNNPWFPVAGAIEAQSAKWFLMEYCLLLPPLHYVWIRARQPQRDAAAGWALAMGILTFYLFCHMYTSQASISFASVLIAASLMAAVPTLVACWKFHRQIEVQS